MGKTVEMVRADCLRDGIEVYHQTRRIVLVDEPIERPGVGLVTIRAYDTVTDRPIAPFDVPVDREFRLAD